MFYIFVISSRFLYHYLSISFKACTSSVTIVKSYLRQIVAKRKPGNNNQPTNQTVGVILDTT